MDLAEAALNGIAPRLCAACGRIAGGPTCRRCEDALEAAAPLTGPGPPGLDRAWSSAPHEGPARALVVALKFRRLLPVADLIGARIARLAPAAIVSGTLVPVPSPRLRRMRRGFDPAAEIAAAVAARTGLPAAPCLGRRGRGRQVGRRRAERLGSPPRIVATSAAPASVVLIDDVMTTGATLTSCAAALRGAGAIRVVAVTFTRRV